MCSHWKAQLWFSSRFQRSRTADLRSFLLDFSASGYGVIGAIEDHEEYDIKNQIDTNFMGVYNIMQLTLPHFRERQKGRYVIFSSSSALIGVPGFARMSNT